MHQLKRHIVDFEPVFGSIVVGAMLGLILWASLGGVFRAYFLGDLTVFGTYGPRGSHYVGDSGAY